ncbi:MAG: response regulator [Burkholderiaceae bacterium]
MLDSDLINTTIERGKHVVLVVDDDPTTLYTTSRVLRSAGFQTLEAATGTEALAHAGSGVSAVVLDVQLPDINGFEICRRLRARPETAMLPVMHLSAAYIRDEDKVTGLDSGADAYLIHPVEPAVLIATLQALIRARTAEEQLRRSESRFRAIYSHAQSGIALIDAQGRFADVNPAMVQLLGRPKEALLGRAVTEFAPASWLAFVQEKILDPADPSGVVKSEFPLLRGNGEEVYLDWRMSSHIEPALRIGIAQDITGRKQLDQRRMEILDREQAARLVAERHNRTKDDFIAVLSHELRTPLNTIGGWAEVLKLRSPSAEALRGLDVIERSVKTLARIISDILDVSRINSGKLQLEPSWCDPAELVAACTTSLQAQTQVKNLGVELNLGQAHAPAWMDAQRFQQICWNLLSNAIKFSFPGGVIRIALDRRGDLLELTVQDFGQGIAGEFMDHVFERFSQSDAPGNRRHGGLGLGLSIVKHLAERHGGSVKVNSAGSGMGTTLRVELHVGQSPESTANGACAESGDLRSPEVLERQVLAGLDILVVEDDADASEMLRIVLAERGADVRTANDAASALKAVAQIWPQVLVSDIGLPGRDGYELMHEVRELSSAGNHPRPVAIALSAFAREKDQNKAIDAGFDMHLSKPLQPHTLVSAIATLSQARKKPGTSA